MPTLNSILEELSEQMESTNGGELSQGALLRGLAGARLKHELRKESREEMLEKLFTISGTAWIEVLSEKVKADITRTHGTQLDKLAKIISEAGTHRVTTVIEALCKKEEFKEQVLQQFAQAHK